MKVTYDEIKLSLEKTPIWAELHEKLPRDYVAKPTEFIHDYIENSEHGVDVLEAVLEVWQNPLYWLTTHERSLYLLYLLKPHINTDRDVIVKTYEKFKNAALQFRNESRLSQIMLPNSKLEHKLCMAVLAAAQTAALVGQKNLPQGIDSDIIYRDCIDAWEVALEIHWDIRCFSILENYHRYNDYQAVEEIRQMNYEKDLWIDACSSVEDSSWRDRIDGLDFRLDLAQWIIQLGGEPLSPRPFNHAAGTPQQPEGLLEGSLRLLKRILAAKENNTTFEWEKYLCN